MVCHTAWTSSCGLHETMDLLIRADTGGADIEPARWRTRSDLLRTPSAFPLPLHTTTRPTPGRESQWAAVCTVASKSITARRGDVKACSLSMIIAAVLGCVAAPRTLQGSAARRSSP